MLFVICLGMSRHVKTSRLEMYYWFALYFYNKRVGTVTIDSTLIVSAWFIIPQCFAQLAEHFV